MTPEHDIIIVGAGAAGLYCAWLLSQHGLAPLIIEAGPSPGRKLDASGGGFANFSNVHMGPSQYLCHPDADFCATALSEFVLDNFITMLKNWQLPYKIRPDGCFFLDVGARNLVHSFMGHLAKNGAKFNFRETARAIHTARHGFKVETDKNCRNCRTLVMATGSPAAPWLAGPVDSWNLAFQLGHDVGKAIPALTPMIYTLPEDGIFRRLAGIAVPCGVILLKDNQPVREVAGRVLFTHKGLSGPAIFSISLYWEPNSTVQINFLPAHDFEKMLDSAERQTPRSTLRALLPDRLADALLPGDLARVKNAQLSRKTRHFLSGAIHRRQFRHLVPAGLKQAEVCRGGVQTNGVYPGSMESKLRANLYFIGEMLDVTGELGGYNLHWAWASATACARSIIRKRAA